jgi:hypothetical protein
MARALLAVDSIWRKYRTAWTVAGLALLACLQPFESKECGYSEMSAGIEAVENRFGRKSTKGDGSRIASKLSIAGRRPASRE